jgi:chromate transporter
LNAVVREEAGGARTVGLVALGCLFARLGFTAVGGPAAHIALMRRELVDQRQWLTDGEFLDLVGASNAIPGPTSTEVAMYTGRRHGGIPGLIVAGLGFIAPAALIVGVLAWAYVRYGTRPAVDDVLAGVKPVVVAIVLVAVVRLGHTAFTSRLLVAIGAAVLVAYLAGLNEPVLLLVASGVAATAGRWRQRPSGGAALAAVIGLPAVVATQTADPDLPRIFGAFFKIGALLFGSGYVLLAFLRRDLVLSYGWLTEGQILDAIAIGQLTPGPVFTTATFVGYLLRGVQGALVATVAIFLPAFVMTAVLEPVIAKLRAKPVTAAALDGLNAAAVALMVGVTWFLARDAVVDVPTALLAIGSLAVLLRWEVNPVWLMAAGAVVGVLVGGLG